MLHNHGPQNLRNLEQQMLIFLAGYLTALIYATVCMGLTSGCELKWCLIHFLQSVVTKGMLFSWCKADIQGSSLIMKEHVKPLLASVWKYSIGPCFCLPPSRLRGILSHPRPVALLSQYEQASQNFHYTPLLLGTNALSLGTNAILLGIFIFHLLTCLLVNSVKPISHSCSRSFSLISQQHIKLNMFKVSLSYSSIFSLTSSCWLP